MDIARESRKPRNMCVAIANLASALAEVADEYDQGGLSSDNWQRIRAARVNIEFAITAAATLRKGAG